MAVIKGPVNINVRPERDGARVCITARDGVEIILSWSRSEIREIVSALCEEAGLPEPWKQG